MTKITVLSLAVLFAAVLVSCDLLLEDVEGDSATFYAQNFDTNKFYTLTANKLHEGARCVIWAEKGAKVSKTQAQKIADEYDNVIRPRVVNAFSKKNFKYTFDGEELEFTDMLEFANWIVDRDDNKLTILMLDIKDGFSDPKTDAYTAGYFWSGNFFPQKGQNAIENSNERDMIYIDTYPSLDADIEQVYSTFAHELQHLINFVTTVQAGRGSAMDTWVNEGLSSQAEYLYLGDNPPDKLEWFNKDSEGTIAKGNNFFVWGNHQDKSRAILDDYATVYLFFRWLSLQAGTQSSLFQDIITSNDPDYRAVTGAAKDIKTQWSGWNTLLEDWFTANYNPTSGYAGDSALRDNIKVKAIGGTATPLFPGEGVYSVGSGSGNSGNIRYVGLSGNAANGNMRLTFNTSTNKEGVSESGPLTGNPPPAASVSLPPQARTAGYTHRPYVIDAADLWGRDREWEMPGTVKPLRNKP